MWSLNSFVWGEGERRWFVRTCDHTPVGFFPLQTTTKKQSTWQTLKYMYWVNCYLSLNFYLSLFSIHLPPLLSPTQIIPIGTRIVITINVSIFMSIDMQTDRSGGLLIHLKLCLILFICATAADRMEWTRTLGHKDIDKVIHLLKWIFRAADD